VAIALGGAGAIAVLLIGGQILFPAKGYEVQQVALQETIEMNGSGGNEPTEPQPFDPDARVAMRIPAEPIPDGDKTADHNEAGTNADSAVVAAGYESPEPSTNDESEDAPAEPAAVADRNEVSENDVSQPADEEPGRARIVEFLGGKLKLDVYKHPLIGSPDAPHVIVEMVSYDCKHCRATHGTMKQALSRYGSQVAVIIMIVPLDRECNKLVTNAAASHRGACATARMVLSVATLKPSAFPKFHDWLMADKERPPALTSIIARAYGLVNRQRVRELSDSEQVKTQIEGYINLFATLQRQNSGKEFGLPVQILGDHVMSGTVEKPADIHRAWEEHLGVKPR
jgi:protein-disulfide isomerase